MSNSALRIFCRVVERRLRLGEDLEEILACYPNLTENEKEQIREAVEED
jgi:uncharacterized protein (DUF433 family)